MTDDERRAAFAIAFFRQARSDWTRYRAWAGSEPEPCHSLHYLQMSCEKLAKAYRLRDTDSPLDDLLTSHVGFEKFVSTFLLVTLREEYRGRDAQLQGLARKWRRFAREVEKLAPSVDPLTTPENAEYPWERSGIVIAPCDHDFSALALHKDAGGRAFLLLIQRAFDAFPTT